MKKTILLCLAVLIGTAAISQTREEQDPRITALLEIKDSLNLQKNLSSLLKSKKEEDLTMLSAYYSAKRNGVMRDSVNKVAIQHFPNGYAAMDDALNVIYEEKDGVANEENYKKFIKKFGKNPRLKNHPFIDYASYYVAVCFKKDPAKLKGYLQLIRDTSYKTKAYSYAAREAAGAKQFVLAQELIEKSMSDLKGRGDSSSKDYSAYSAMYASILFENKSYAKGLSYIRPVYLQSKGTNPAIKDTYLNLLVANGELKEAFPLMSESIKTGRSTPGIREKFRSAYQAFKSTEQGFESFEKSLRDSLQQKVSEKVKAKLINEPGFNFSIKDTEGKIVNLSDYKGKVVVLDFWATWCGPCKASFPNMQTAVDHYRNDPEVVFLFIHSWETSATPVKDAAAYVKDNGYTFKVLMDTKDPADGVCKAAKGFNIQGLPTKLILGKDGNIRFRSMGSAVGANEEFLMEMSAMVELARTAS